MGSGPSIGDTTTFEEALGILRKYRLEKKAPAAVTALLEKGIAKKIAETPLPDSNHFLRNSHFLLGDNTTALEAARKSAEEQGIPAYILTSTDKGEAAQTAVVYGDLIKEILHGNAYRKTNAKQYPVPPPTSPQPHVAGPPEASFNSLLAREIRANLKHQCNGVLPSRGLLLSGGELTVTLRDKGYERGFERGKGGRNQEFLLALLTELKDETCPFYICSVGTDGIDGPTDAAGAWIDHRTMEKVRRLGL
ncbi:MAG: DUF4147 domain-containing protein, partial [bacterium]|nr:DUF4147 domain-containing protein [bacterium]